MELEAALEPEELAGAWLEPVYAAPDPEPEYDDDAGAVAGAAAALEVAGGLERFGLRGTRA